MEAFIGAFSGVWLALFIIIFAACGTFTATVGNMFWSIIVLAAGAGILQFLVGISILSIFITNPLLVIAVLAIYIGIGAAYTGLWRWPAYLRKMSAYIQEMFDRWKHAHDKQLAGKSKEEAFEEFLDSSHYAEFHPSRNKERLSTWVVMWPFAMGWELSHKPLIWVFETVYYTLGDMFVAIGKQTARKNIKLD
jgi:hypothetical protein